MSTKYEIRQSVYCVNKRWHETVYSTQVERMARRSFEEMVIDNPNDYFELVKVEHSETCLEFTSKDS